MSDELDARLAEARRTLMGIPGVVAVGWGYKSRGGTTTQELSLLVYVREKRPPGDVPPDELVPEEVLGLRTDVQTVPVTDPTDCRSSASFDPLEGGIHISNLKPYVSGASMTADFGTLGFFGTIDSSSSKDRIVLLSNNHVLTADGGAAGDTIYQPRVTYGPTSLSLNPKELHPVAKIDNVGFHEHKAFTYDGDPAASALDYWLDCATAKVNTCFSSWCDTNCGVGFSIVVHGLQVGTPASDVIEGIARLRPSDLTPASNYVVYKVGQTTGRTVGKVTSVLIPTADRVTGAPQNNVIQVENTGPNCEGGTRFIAQGDSGAVLVNADRKIIGLLFAESDAGKFGYACHIHPVVHWLDITLLARGADAGASGAGTLVRAELDPSVGGEAVARAAYLREQILRSERGQLYRTLVERHRAEVVHLVNRSRPVTVSWHRLQGPEFLSHMLQASRHADHSVPREIAGVSRDEAFERFLDTLERNGSPDLSATVEEHREQLRDLLGASDDLDAVSERLRDEATAPDLEPVR